MFDGSSYSSSHNEPISPKFLKNPNKTNSPFLSMAAATLIGPNLVLPGLSLRLSITLQQRSLRIENAPVANIVSQTSKLGSSHCADDCTLCLRIVSYFLRETHSTSARNESISAFFLPFSPSPRCVAWPLSDSSPPTGFIPRIGLLPCLTPGVAGVPEGVIFY